jgi:hypothetical protein
VAEEVRKAPPVEKEFAGSPSARDRQPISGAKLNFLFLFCEAKRQKRVFLFLGCFVFICYHVVVQLEHIL